MSLNLSTRHMVCGSFLDALSTGILLGSGTLDFVKSTLGPFLSSTADANSMHELLTLTVIINYIALLSSCASLSADEQDCYKEG